MNRFSIIGRIVKKPELRYTKENKAVSDVVIATNEKDAQFIRTAVFDKQAENINKYCDKGSLIAVTGFIKNHNYEDKNGEKRYEYTFVCQNVEFLSSNQSQKQSTNESNIKPSEEPYAEFGSSVEISDTEISF